jgi:hypothetical protein
MKNCLFRVLLDVKIDWTNIVQLIFTAYISRQMPKLFLTAPNDWMNGLPDGIASLLTKSVSRSIVTSTHGL